MFRRISTITCFGVLDGHGGKHAAEHCKDFIPNFLASAISGSGRGKYLSPGESERILIDCFCTADREYINKAGTIQYNPHDLSAISASLEKKQPQTAGCTACVVEPPHPQTLLGGLGAARGSRKGV